MWQVKGGRERLLGTQITLLSSGDWQFGNVSGKATLTLSNTGSCEHQMIGTDPLLSAAKDNVAIWNTLYIHGPCLDVSGRK